MINRVTLLGNLGKDPEVRTLENGSKVATFTLATTESYKDKNDTWQKITEWHSIVAWRNLADRAERDLKKGSSVFVEGKISYRKYEKDGVEKYITEIVASTINSLEKREKSASAPTSTDDSIPSGSDENLPF